MGMTITKVLGLDESLIWWQLKLWRGQTEDLKLNREIRMIKSIYWERDVRERHYLLKFWRQFMSDPQPQNTSKKGSKTLWIKSVISVQTVFCSCLFFFFFFNLSPVDVIAICKRFKRDRLHSNVTLFNTCLIQFLKLSGKNIAQIAKNS